MEKKNDITLFNSQQAVLTQSLRFSLKILEMNNTELQEFINESLIENPFLKEDDNLNDALFSSLSETSSLIFGETENIAAKNSFYDDLLKQIAFFKFNDQQIRITKLLYDCIREHKYIDSDLLQQISKEENIPYSDLLNIIKKLQTLSPLGLFSFNVQDKIKNILELSGKCSKEHNIFIYNINVLFSEGLSAFRKRINLDDKTLCKVISDIKKAGYSTFVSDNSECSYRIPDIIVEKKGKSNNCSSNCYETYVADIQIPAIDKDLYETSYKKVRTANDKKYIKEKIENAELLIKSIHYRNSTLLKVAQEIVHRQKDFLSGEAAFLVPINVKIIANAIMCHPSTVHRAIMNKTIATPQGIYEIKELMPKEIKAEGNDDTANVATDHSIKQYIRKLVDNEPRNSPYSDGEIVCLLERRGINISRRTIAKYRNDISIANSNIRLKEYNSMLS